MDHRTTELVSLGVDWITATTKWAESTQRMLDWASSQITVEMQRGNDRQWWAMSGFQGHKCGQVQTGFRDDEGIVRLSADYARERWRELYDLCDNVSRLDLQCTTRNELKPHRRVLSDWKRAKRQASKKLKGAEVTIISKMRGGDTFYSGSPQSNKYGRCYDKEAQSKLDHYRGCVRHEVQYNGKLAMLIARDIVASSSGRSRIASHVSSFWRARLGVFMELGDATLQLCCTRPQSDDERRLQWMKEALGPSARSLVARGRAEDFLTALGLRVNSRGELETVE